MKKFLLSLLSVTLFYGVSIAQTITTIAGNGSAGYSGDGGAATAATLFYPHGLSFDPYGNLYVADEHNHRIRKISSSGIISTVAGTGTAGFSGDGGPATNAMIDQPYDVACDAVGDIYISDYNNNRIRMVNTSGVITTVAGTGAASSTGDGGPATAATLYNPCGLTIDAFGNIYFGQEHSEIVRKINAAGIISTYAGTGSIGFSGDGGAATNAALHSPNYVCADAIGNLYISDNGNHRVRKVDTAGIITTFAGNGSSSFGGDGGPATAAQLSYPAGIIIDYNGNVLISDYNNNRIRKVDGAGIISTIAGTGSSSYSGDGSPATSAGVNPTGLVFDLIGNLYIADYQNNRIRKVQSGATYISDSFKIFLDKYCSGPQIKIVPNHYTAGMYVKTYFGDSYTDSTLVPSAGVAVINHSYGSNGTYSIKQVLYSGSTIVDSFQFTYSHLLCNSFSVKFYYDANSNCVKDTSDDFIGQPVTVEIDSNGTAIDTVSATSGLYYMAYGAVGDVYGFKIISGPAGFHATCPTSGIVYDTIGTGTYSAPIQYVGMECITSTNFDLAVFPVIYGSTINDQYSSIYVQNSYCMPVNATVTLHYSQKYDDAPRDISPSPTSVTAGTITWNLSSLSGALPAPIKLGYGLWHSSAVLNVGDTVHSSFFVAPDTGDVDTSNNHDEVIDTVRGGFDPNEISVKPAGCIASGTTPTQLTYTINFENTGNDTAHNIYVMDTLSDYVDVSSMRLVMSSHEMYISKLKDALGHNILKFDFPTINLLDSSHHGKCDGAVIFNINTKPGLATGTNINNRAGIYFDVNAVVMTNQVTNGIGCPVVNDVKPVSNNNTIDIYPNPVNNVLHIKLDAEKYQSYTISNSFGSSLLSGTLTGNNTQLNIQTLPAGLYFINLKGDGGNEVRKFVKW